MGINHSTQGTDTVSLINTLALITGNIGRTGAAPMSITGQCNAMGSREFSFTSSMPGYRKFEEERDRLELAQMWGVEVSRLPEERGLYKKMEVGEQALYLAQLKGMNAKEAKTELRKWFEKFEIQDWWNKKIEELSK